MTRSERQWNAAIAEHEAAVREFLAVCEQCGGDDWHCAAPDKWSTAAVALHICNAYELARNAMAGGAGMRLRVSKRYAWVLRTFVLPVVVATTRFPRVRAPREVVPDAEEAKLLDPTAVKTRLTRAAREAADAFRSGSRDRAAPKMTHAYFGPLRPYVALRLLTAHTRHHTRGLAQHKGRRA